MQAALPWEVSYASRKPTIRWQGDGDVPVVYMVSCVERRGDRKFHEEVKRGNSGEAFQSNLDAAALRRSRVGKRCACGNVSVDECGKYATRLCSAAEPWTINYVRWHSR